MPQPLIALAVAAAAVLLPARPAAAHPLDVYLQAAYLSPAPDAIRLELAISPGVLVAPDALADLDTDADRRITDTEAHAFAERVLARLHMSVGDTVLRAGLTGVEMPPYPTIQAGYGTIRLFARAPGAPAGPGAFELHFRNDHVPRGAAYQVNATVEERGPVALGRQQRDATQRESRIGYRIDPTTRSPQVVVSRPRTSDRLAGVLESGPLSPAVVLLALAFAALLGASHALTPGHAKTLIAAYLVGSGGTLRNALTLGAVVTFTHTASVIGIGLVALLAGRVLVPGVLMPVMATVSGVLVLAIGLRLVRRRWPGSGLSAGGGARGAGVPPGPAHVSGSVRPSGIGGLAGVGDAHGSRGDAHGSLGRVHGPGRGHDHGHGHSHLPPDGKVTAGGLIGMGVSGGLVPCPEALGVMVLAVGVNRTLFGLGLILAFSLGLGAVLVGLGVLLVRSRRLIDRFARVGDRWGRVLPFVSAVVVTVLGAGLLWQGVRAGLPLIAGP
ncbi:hypothetical protein [Virgisporangium aliadipatigenens]|nr:hypothetical protein [Virgisporangium aliadipatigenens]